MRVALALLLLSTTLALSACGLGETAATANLQAEQAAQLQQQAEQLKQQIEAANAQSNKRLEESY
jgi:cell division protein FtsB